MSIVDRPFPAPAAPQAGLPRQAPITLAMYDRMIAADVFDPAEAHRLELIGGELHRMSPIGDRHADAGGRHPFGGGCGGRSCALGSTQF
jgi:hypothetical protein